MNWRVVRGFGGQGPRSRLFGLDAGAARGQALVALSVLKDGSNPIGSPSATRQRDAVRKALEAAGIVLLSSGPRKGVMRSGQETRKTERRGLNR